MIFGNDSGQEGMRLYPEKQKTAPRLGGAVCLGSVPLPGLEPGLSASEADTLSSELQGQATQLFSHRRG